MNILNPKAPGPLHWTSLERDPKPQYPCSNRDCAEASRDEDDYRKCEACGLRFCPECLVMFNGIPFCDICRVCEECRQPAGHLCGECGALRCDAHVRAIDAAEPDTGYRHSGVVCRGGCGEKEAA